MLKEKLYSIFKYNLIQLKWKMNAKWRKYITEKIDFFTFLLNWMIVFERLNKIKTNIIRLITVWKGEKNDIRMLFIWTLWYLYILHIL